MLKSERFEMAKDYYNLLGVPRSASEREIRAAFRRLARKHHPDLNPGQPDAAERFKEINEAHEVLSNAESRRLYDRFGGNWKQAQQFGQQGPPGASHVRWGPGQAGSGAFDDLLGDFDLGDVFGRFFGGGRGGVGTTSRPRPRPTTLEQPVELTLEEAHDGAVRAIQVTRQAPCMRCGGQGRASGGMCPACLGRGFTFQPTRGEARIPPGVESGSRVRVNAGGQEVLLVITVRPDPRFRRTGADLHAEVGVPLYDALLGGEVVVQMLKGSVALTMPPETPNGRVFRLANQGMPHLGRPSEKGALYVSAKVVLPAKLSEEERRRFEELRGLRKK